ncbi:hypothetical protein KQI84_13280 [bacterium]|nr:hypothetical protein [bacterium]
MTDDKFPPDQDPENNGQENSHEDEGLTWERPGNGQPVYGVDQQPGEEPQSAMPPPLPDQAPPSPQPEPGPLMGPPPIGPAQPPPAPQDFGQGQGYGPPPDYGPPPPQDQGQQQYPGYQQGPLAGPPYTQPDQNCGQGAYGQQQGYGQQGYGQQGYGYGPAPQQPSGRRPEDQTKLTIALVGAIIGFIVMCCCWPITLVSGIMSTVLASEPRKQARARGESDTFADVMFYLGFALIIMSLVWGALNIIVAINDPQMMDRFMQSLNL